MTGAWSVITVTVCYCCMLPVYERTIKVDIVMHLTFTHLPKSVWHLKLVFQKQAGYGFNRVLIDVDCICKVFEMYTYVRNSKTGFYVDDCCVGKKSDQP